MSTTDPTKLAERLSKVKHILLVLSGKGGVGKSSMSVQIALSLLNQQQGPEQQNDDSQSSGNNKTSSRKPARIGLLDIDLTGPSIPRMLGLDGASIHQSNDGWVPVYMPIQHLQPSAPARLGNQEENDQPASDAPPLQDAQASSSSSTTTKTVPIVQDAANGNVYTVQDELKVMSIGFLLKDSRQAVVWRGPKKSAMIRQFLVDVRWGELDWLIIDTPPGTSDEHISLLENLLPALQASPSTTLHSVLVTTPQAVSLSDVSKELSFTRRVGLPVVGLIENMSGYVCPHCGDITNIFGKGGGEEFCRIESEKAEEAAKKRNHIGASNGTDPTGGITTAELEARKLTFLGRVPVDPDFVKVVDGPDSGKGLLERYNKTKSSVLLRDICATLVQAIGETTTVDSGSVVAAVPSVTV